ncbi:SMI1/KNR4 family protein [Enhygromyxa salina]|uniref:SMI1/KNR4 family protein n=1 Tax=Enhygromyxa salina TaxID=215803 RepID=UPI0011BA981A|nr:SMI1/KNR4 family protein [Enhygromyxa salina]
MHVETEFEALLERLVPGCGAHCVGASLAEIDELEAFVGQPLPPFYRWFLTKMGRNMGPLGYPRVDMSVGTLLSIYRSGFKPPRASLLLVASEADDIMPMYMFCDLAKRTRDDALVCSYEKNGGVRQDEAETLREDIAWGVFIRSRFPGSQQCSGMFRDEGGDVLGSLEPVLERFQFETLHRSGPRCGLYECENAALDCVVPPGDGFEPDMSFTLRGDETTIRSILGVIGVETSLAIRIERWTPPLVR